MKRISLIALPTLLATTALSPAALAQGADAVDAVLACRGIADIEARVACFDTAAARLAAQRESGDIIVVERQDVEAVERESFGFDLPSLPRFRMPSFTGSGQHDAVTGAVMAEADRVAAEPAPVPDTAATPETPATPAANPDRGPDVTPTPAPAPAPTPAPAPAARPEPAPEPETVQIVERDEDGGVHTVSMEIERFRRVGYNTTVFHMTNGQVWRQIDDIEVRTPRGDGHQAEIRRAAMGSYLLRVNGEGRAIRVRREQ